MKVLVTGSTGLVGSEAVIYYSKAGHEVYGIDNNMREYYFGKDASNSESKKNLIEKWTNYRHFDIDIRNMDEISEIFEKHGPFDIILHAAAQPSHDWAKKEPMTDFTVNANGTMVLLENFRLKSPNAVFLFTSTNKVYGDAPNSLPLIETGTRYEIKKGHEFENGISENMSIDNSKHSLFGASKLAADIMVQEYGKYFGLKTGIFRCGCITGKSHTGVELHGFLSYLVKCISKGKEYTIFGYKGKQVRDNLHAFDLITAMDEYAKSPRKGEVYNMGGSRHSNVSILEAIRLIESISKKKAKIKISGQSREGDHIWYISDISKFRSHYPNWEYNYDMNMIIKDILKSA